MVNNFVTLPNHNRDVGFAVGFNADRAFAGFQKDDRCGKTKKGERYGDDELTDRREPNAAKIFVLVGVAARAEALGVGVLFC